MLNRHKPIAGISPAIAIAALALLSGCSRTHKVRSVEPSGFLRDYSQLQPGTADQASLVYINPAVEWTSYDKIVIEPVSILTEGGRKSVFRKVSDEDLNLLASQLHACLEAELGQDYKIVNQPGPGVIRVRAAITEAEGSKLLLDTISNIAPPAIVISTAKRLAMGTHTGVGTAGVEAELLDGSTGKRLVAVVDRQAGTKMFRGKLDTWDDVHSAYQMWSAKLRARLAEKRGVVK